MILEIISQFPIAGEILAGLGSLLVFSQTIVLLTPSPKDDAWLESFKEKSLVKKIWGFLVGFAPLKKKEGKLLPSHEDK